MWTQKLKKGLQIGTHVGAVHLVHSVNAIFNEYFGYPIATEGELEVGPDINLKLTRSL